ncbi:MAG: hypothetical protein ACK4YF_08365, partial [Exilispira sp.]
IKKVNDLKVDIYKTKGIITKIFFLDTDKIYLYELTSEKNPKEYALLLSNNKYRRGDKPEIVVESFRLKKDNFEENKEEYHSILKNYILKKTLFSNTEIILLMLKIDIIVKQYLEKNESVVIILESHQNRSQE